MRVGSDIAERLSGSLSLLSNSPRGCPRIQPDAWLIIAGCRLPVAGLLFAERK